MTDLVRTLILFELYSVARHIDWLGWTQDYQQKLHVESFHLSMILMVICILMGGQIGLKKVVDDGNLTAFIIRYRLLFTFTRTVYFLAYYYCFPLDTLIPLFTANR
jgi:hypothetical protein